MGSRGDLKGDVDAAAREVCGWGGGDSGRTGEVEWG